LEKGMSDIGTIARLLDLDPRRVQQLRKEKILPAGPRGQYPIAECVIRYIRYLRKLIEGQGGLSLTAERTRFVKAAASLKDLELRIRQGELLSHAEVLHGFLDRLAYVRSGLLSFCRTLPGKLEGKNQREMGAVIKKAVHRLLNYYAKPVKVAGGKR
jgi:hypothetical protein